MNQARPCRWHVKIGWWEFLERPLVVVWHSWLGWVTADSVEDAFNEFVDQLHREQRLSPPVGAQVLVRHADAVPGGEVKP